MAADGSMILLFGTGVLAGACKRELWRDGWAIKEDGNLSLWYAFKEGNGLDEATQLTWDLLGRVVPFEEGVVAMELVLPSFGNVEDSVDVGSASAVGFGDVTMVDEGRVFLAAVTTDTAITTPSGYTLVQEVTFSLGPWHTFSVWELAVLAGTEIPPDSITVAEEWSSITVGVHGLGLVMATGFIDAVAEPLSAPSQASELPEFEEKDIQRQVQPHPPDPTEIVVPGPPWVKDGQYRRPSEDG